MSVWSMRAEENPAVIRSRWQHVLVLTAALLAVAGLAEPAPAAPAVSSTRVYASANGSGAVCSAARPCSLTTARARVRALVVRQRHDIDVVLAGGAYRLAGAFELGPQDSGANGHTVTWQ